MCKIEAAVVDAIKSGKAFSGQNTQITYDDKCVSIWLHGNRLASYDGQLMIHPVSYDYPTQTTCSRLNAFFQGIGWSEYKAMRRGGKLITVGGKV